ncbi:MAG: carbon-nitrogen hydrolase family protein, partial [Candidatus Methanoperedens sp.]|nr:carbon-nitrogen hydrolase family protein [Candidatus Methanoperedens sp.]
MSRHLIAAAVQMDTALTPTHERLSRADALVAEAANAGAQLVALPELFNTGYTYSDTNYARAETMDGETVSWMKQAAAQYGVHVAGTLLLIDGDHVYNSALLFAPDGRMWRYDKNYPWGWERAYYREGHDITVADTDLGKFGMIICWDYAHPELWQRYAGKIDAILMLSCPPKVAEMVLTLPDGTKAAISDQNQFYEGNDQPFGADLNAQTAWLGVPLVNSTGTGQLRTHLPNPYLSILGGLAQRPDLWALVAAAPPLEVESGFYPQAKIVNARGETLCRVTADGDGFVVGEIELADQPPLP